MTGRSSLLMCTIWLPTSLRSRCASREYGVTPFALRSGVGDGGFAPEAIPTGWVSEGMTELRRQGFFRWGWTQESAVVAALFDIEWFDEDTPLDTVEGRHASQGKLLGQLTVNCVGGTARRPKDAGRAAQTLVLELAPDLVSLPPKIRCSDVATTCRCRRLSVAQPLHNLPPPPLRTESCRWGQPRPN